MSWAEKFRVLNEIAKAYLGKENYFNQEDEKKQEREAFKQEEDYWENNLDKLILRKRGERN